MTALFGWCLCADHGACAVETSTGTRCGCECHQPEGEK